LELKAPTNLVKKRLIPELILFKRKNEKAAAFLNDRLWPNERSNR